MQGPKDDPSAMLDPQTRAFYLRALDTLDHCGVQYVVGGAYALVVHAGVVRHTKDLDVFLRREDFPRVMKAFESAGYRTERTHPHWLGKAYDEHGDAFIDLIYGSGNGLCQVDEEWLRNAVDGLVLGTRPAKLSPCEEIIWSKAFIQERNRFDGADVAHLLLACGRRLDWARLLHRFSRHERVLLAHLVLFGYIYPSERAIVPAWVMDDLIGRMKSESAATGRVCRGTFLSWEQYLSDVRERGFLDARSQPGEALTPEEVERWTDAPK
jgi:hypothetical protein